MHVGLFVHWHTSCRTVSTPPKSVHGCNAGTIGGGKKNIRASVTSHKAGAPKKLDESPSAC